MSDLCKSCGEYDVEDMGTTVMAQQVAEIHAMLTDIKAMLDPLKAVAASFGPMQKMGMSPAGKAALDRLKELG